MARDIDQIAQIKAYGVDLDKKRQIDPTFWAPNEAAAQVFVEASKRNEMSPNLTLGPASPRDAKSGLANSLPAGGIGHVHNDQGKRSRLPVIRRQIRL